MEAGSGWRVNWEMVQRSSLRSHSSLEDLMDKRPNNKGASESRDNELELLYQLGIALASGKDLFTTLLTLQTEILKLIEADSLFVAIYDVDTDIVEYPIYFELGVPEKHPSRRLS